MSNKINLRGRIILGLVRQTEDNYALIVQGIDPNGPADKVLLIPEGDCCANCWVEGVSLPSSFPCKITCDLTTCEYTYCPLPQTPAKTEDKDGDVLESFLSYIETDQGRLDFDTRVSHNGYYGGWIQIRLPVPLSVEEASSLRFITEDF